MNDAKKSKLVKLLNLVSSDSDGEALTAARLAVKLLDESGESWGDLLGVTAKKDNKAAYAKGYRAGFKKGHASRGVMPHQQRSQQRRRHGNTVGDRVRIVKIFEDFFAAWDRLAQEEKTLVTESVEFFNVNRCLYLHDYDRLKVMLRKYWDVIYD